MEEVEEKLMTPKKFSIAIEKTVKEVWWNLYGCTIRLLREVSVRTRDD